MGTVARGGVDAGLLVGVAKAARELTRRWSWIGTVLARAARTAREVAAWVVLLDQGGQRHADTTASAQDLERNGFNVRMSAKAVVLVSAAVMDARAPDR